MYVVIHLDSDVFRSKEVPKKYSFEFKDKEGRSLTTIEIVERIKDLLIAEIGREVYDKYSDRILFAIAVDGIECWLLPFYETGKKRSKEKNCLKTLNQSIVKKFNFTIDKKKPKYYAKISRAMLKQKNFSKLHKLNPSLAIFCEQLDDLPEG